MGMDDRDIRTRTDGDGRTWLIDKDGEYVKDEKGNKIPPMQLENDNKTAGFTTYDMSQGHCGLCGSLTCRGGCFK
jgi:hypothetical protein